MGNIMNESKGKISTVFYHEWLEVLTELSDEEAGKLLMALLRYDADGTIPNFRDNRVLSVLFKDWSKTIKRNRDNYEETCEKRRESIAKRYKKVQEPTKVYKSIQEPTKVGDNDNEYDNDSDNEYEYVNEYEYENENDNESGGGGDNKAQPPHPPLSENEISLIVEAWNLQSCTNNIKGIANGKRMTNTLGCINGNFGAFLDTIRDLDNQKYFAGRKITFDWFAMPENYQKVAEGNYRDIFGAKTKGTTREEIMNLL